ncbi:aldehyde dehydrogenase [Amycolatopsis sp.]|uniref:aldehyde dehydrogenase n=1 Tax=Amycolatopsis sp. TaxID=37632 RepID=UPI002C335766|nr:aldehyde dehydrogenase [Amycolatopsis sp.]HVV08136.1 aldehyde dehydrogenase [Amycolatopsis sp.]
MYTSERLFLGGDWRTPAGGERIEVVSPATEQRIGHVPAAGKEDVAAAVSYAREAFDHGPWPLADVTERVAIVRALADAIDSRTAEFADVLCAEQGLPRHSLPAGQIAKAVGAYRAYAEIAEAEPWVDTRPGTGGRTLSVGRLPVGVVAAIVPWNAPLFVAAMKLAPALIAGNTVILKPPPETPLHTTLFADAVREAGLPPGVLNILPAGAEAGEQLVRHPGVDKVSFTGSTTVGRQVGAICGAELKRCTLELGGKSAAIVLEDFELSPAGARQLVAGAMVNAGQVCAAQTRILAPRSRYRDLVAAVAETAAALPVGDPLDPATVIGPLISARQRTRVEGYIASGTREGASLVTGGTRPDLERGFYVRPTVFVDVTAAMTIAREEIFGPVVAILPYDTEDEAVALANDSDYGLAGAVWTGDVEHGAAVARRVRTGSVSVNSPGALDIRGPFGGFKQSGFGREGGPEGLAEYTGYQTILLPAQASS